MIKATMLLYRAPHLSRAQFLEYWGKSHAALAKEHAATMNIRRYVQVHPVDSPLIAQSAPGVAALRAISMPLPKRGGTVSKR